MLVEHHVGGVRDEVARDDQVKDDEDDERQQEEEHAAAEEVRRRPEGVCARVARGHAAAVEVLSMVVLGDAQDRTVGHIKTFKKQNSTSVVYFLF